MCVNKRSDDNEKLLAFFFRAFRYFFKVGQLRKEKNMKWRKKKVNIELDFVALEITNHKTIFLSGGERINCLSQRQRYHVDSVNGGIFTVVFVRCQACFFYLFI